MKKRIMAGIRKAERGARERSRNEEDGPLTKNERELENKEDDLREEVKRTEGVSQ